MSEEYKAKLGWLKAPRELRRVQLLASIPMLPSVSITALPRSVNLRPQQSPVRDQGGRGTCVAFSTTAAREYLQRTDPPGSGRVQLSEQFLYWDCKQHDGAPNANGTYIHTAFECLQREGEPLDASWPYNPKPVPGNQGQGPPPVTVADSQFYYIGGTLALPTNTLDQLKICIANGNVFVTGIPVFPSFFTAPGGNVPMPAPGEEEEGGHALCFVGYRDDPDEPGGGRFIFKNSWGTMWGDQGYGTIPYEYVQKWASDANMGGVVDPFEVRLLGFFDGPEASGDKVELKGFLVWSSSPTRAGDCVTVQFTLRNASDASMKFSPYGVGVGCRWNSTTGANNRDFGFREVTLEPGRSITLAARRMIDAKGTWRFWPAYYLGHWGPFRWHEVTVKAY